MISMRTNRAKQKLAQGRTVVAVGGIFTADMVEAIAPADIDAIWFEGEHGPIDYGHIPELSRACDLWGITPIVRISELAYGPLYRAFDLGAQAVAVPHIDTANQARAMVEAGKFAPIGRRGVATGRQGYGVQDYFEVANDHTMLIAFVEDIKALDALDEILSIDHIDVFFVAPSDLAATMGLIGQPDHPDVMAATDDAIRRIVAKGRVAGSLANTLDDAERIVSMGATFMLSSAHIWLRDAARSFLQKVDRFS